MEKGLSIHGLWAQRKILDDIEAKVDKSIEDGENDESWPFGFFRKGRLFYAILPLICDKLIKL